MAVKKRTGKIANRLKVMGHPARLQILEELLISKDGYTGTLIQKLLGISQSAVSQHLSTLRFNEILDSHRNGVEIFYYIKDEKTKEQMRSILSI